MIKETGIAPDKKEVILRTALRLFTQHGFHGTPTSLIAKEAGVATGTLFHYFKTKEELIDGLYIQVKEQLAQVIYYKLENETTIRGRLYRIWLNTMLWNISHPQELAFFNLFSSSPFISNMTKEEASHYLQPFFLVIADGKALEILKNMPDDLLLDICHGMTLATAKYFMANPSRFDDPIYRDNAFDALWDAIRR